MGHPRLFFICTSTSDALSEKANRVHHTGQLPHGRHQNLTSTLRIVCSGGSTFGGKVVSAECRTRVCRLLAEHVSGQNVARSLVISSLSKLCSTFQHEAGGSKSAPLIPYQALGDREDCRVAAISTSQAFVLACTWS